MVALDPIWTMLFTALFAATAFATARRPALCIVALVATVPFAAAHSILDTTVTLSKVALLGSIAGLLAHVPWKSALSARPVRTVLFAMSAVTLAVALTVAVAAYPAPAIRETLKWIEYTVLVAVVCVAYDRDPDDRLIVVTWAIVTLVVAAAAVLQYALGAPSGFVVNGVVVPRIAGPIEGPNQLAGYLEVSLAVLCAWYRREALLDVAIVAGLCALALTFSRAGIVAAAIGITTILIVRRGRQEGLAAPVAAGAVLGLAAIGVWMALTGVPGLLAAAPPMFSAGGVGYRPELWRAAIALWRRHPLLGTGAGNYELELGSVGLYGVRTHANSWYLQSLAEGGIVLFAATVAFAVTLLRTLAYKLREAAPWQVAAFAASLALIVHQFVDYLVFYPKVAAGWWILVGLGASALRRSLPRRS